ncbi:hypothetical protein [Sphaerimonospora thailandensis]|uniref:Uncharacterized protein n=1 Tax=Sphaerimonospora thailandensis TaxID=795644 RepID=A0A8J3RF48_9ACTN|nr:hypothetical protein [Sphaerimonospora thailandensis]GIH71278.1 hypothetical protein Mth01_35310 [Sphaerimonospora thailandensis]
MVLKKKMARSAVYQILAGGIAGAVAVGVIGTIARPDFSVSYIHGQRAFDYSDERKLAGWADNVFIGRVTAKAGQTTYSTTDIPVTLWSVDVSESLKGSFSGAVTVAQRGGYDSMANQLKVFEEDALLSVGQEYLFATRRNSAELNILTPKYGDVPLSSEQGISAGENSRTAVRERWQRAIANQVPRDQLIPKN